MNKKSHSAALFGMGITIIITSAIFAVALGMFFQIKTAEIITSSYLPTKYVDHYAFNWPVTIAVALGGIMYSFIFFGLAHVTSAIEESKA